MLDHQRDLWADFRAVYGLAPADALALPGPEYLALAYRLPAYESVIRARAEREREQEDDRPAPAAALMSGDLGDFVDYATAS